MNKSLKAVGVGAAIALTTFFIVKAVKGGTEPLPGLANLNGVVTDGYNPISGVAVRLDSLTTHTGTDGRYHFSNIEPGSYNISFEKSGYLSIP
jgi:hypothetical protein